MCWLIKRTATAQTSGQISPTEAKYENKNFFRRLLLTRFLTKTGMKISEKSVVRSRLKFVGLTTRVEN